MKIKKVNKKLSLQKQTITNLRNEAMGNVKGGGEPFIPDTSVCSLLCDTEFNCPVCQYPTVDNYDCDTIAPTAYTCDGGRCHLMSVVPV